MTTLRLNLEEAEIKSYAVIGGDSENRHTGKVVVYGYIKDLLGYDFIADDISSSDGVARYLEISIHATEDESRLAQRESLFIYNGELSVVAYVSFRYFNYVLSLISDNSLKLSLSLEALLTKEETDEFFWGFVKTRKVGIKNVEIDDSFEDYEVIKSGIEIDSKCMRVIPTLTISSSRNIVNAPPVRNSLIPKEVPSVAMLPPKEYPANKNILIVIALLLFFILLKI